MIIVIASAKGGSGKTTTAMHLAAWLSTRRGSAKQAVALHDADPNQSSAYWYRRGTDDYSQRFEMLDHQTAFEASDWDHLVIDSGADPDDSELAELMEAADLLIIPSGPYALDLEQAISTADVLGLQPEQVTLLLTLVPPGRSNRGPTALEVLEQTDIPVCPHFICRRTVVAEAAEMGATVNQLRGDAAEKSWGEHQKVFKSIMKGRQL